MALEFDFCLSGVIVMKNVLKLSMAAVLCALVSTDAMSMDKDLPRNPVQAPMWDAQPPMDAVQVPMHALQAPMQEAQRPMYAIERLPAQQMNQAALQERAARQQDQLKLRAKNEAVRKQFAEQVLTEGQKDAFGITEYQIENGGLPGFSNEPFIYIGYQHQLTPGLKQRVLDSGVLGAIQGVNLSDSLLQSLLNGFLAGPRPEIDGLEVINQKMGHVNRDHIRCAMEELNRFRHLDKLDEQTLRSLNNKISSIWYGSDDLFQYVLSQNFQISAKANDGYWEQKLLQPQVAELQQTVGQQQTQIEGLQEIVRQQQAQIDVLYKLLSAQTTGGQ